MSHTAAELTELLEFLIQNLIFLSSALILFQSSLLPSILGAHFWRFQEIRAVSPEAHDSSSVHDHIQLARDIFLHAQTLCLSTHTTNSLFLLRLGWDEVRWESSFSNFYSKPKDNPYWE